MNRIDRRVFTGLTLAALAAGPARAASSDIVIPLTMDEGLPTAGVTLNGKGPYPFIVASGELFAVVSRELAMEIGLQRATVPDVQARTVRGAVAMELFNTDSLILGGVWDLKKVELVGRPLSSAGVYGMFPYLSIQMSTFDFDVPELRVHRIRVTPPEGAAKSSLVQREGIRAIREQPMVRAQLGGRTVKLVVDTGESEALILYPDAVKRLALWDRSPKSYTRRTVDNDGRAADIRVARGEDFLFGGQIFAHPVITMMSPALARADLLDVDGRVGMDLLRRFKITFDPIKQNVWFSPNRQLTDDFRYDRGGLDVDYEAAGMRVARVDPGSPAERAGLREDDLIVAAHGVTSGSLAWMLSGRAGDTIGLTIERAGAQRDVTLTLEDRL